jgi:hypothetical protein
MLANDAPPNRLVEGGEQETGLVHRQSRMIADICLRHLKSSIRVSWPSV